MYLQWIINRHILRIRDESGFTETPSARDIYLAETADNTIRNKLGIFLTRPSIDLPHISFSKYPLDLYIIVFPPRAEVSRTASCRIAGIQKNTRVYIDDFHTGIPDHYVAENVWYPLLQEGIQEISQIFNELQISGPGNISLKQYFALRQQYSETLIVDEGLIANGEDSKVETLEPSPLFVGSLYPYQENGYRWLELVSKEDIGCILADEMGLGKTIQVICLFSNEKFLNKGSSLVLAPATILENWKREIHKFAPKLTVMIHRGSERTGFPSDLRAFDIIITSYETALRDLSIIEMIDWNVLVVDEAQAIKNPLARRTQLIKQIPHRMAIAVTGTPLENHLSDLWSITDFVFPDLLGDLKSFQTAFPDNISAAMAIEPLISPILLRRKVKDVADDLPPRIDVPQCIELTEELAVAYDEIRKKIIADQGGKPTLGTLTKLRMYCTHPILIHKQYEDPVVSSPKYIRLIEILEEIFQNEEKALIFTSYSDMIKILVNDIKNRFNVYADFIDGSIAVEDRQDRVDRFGDQQGAALLVLNPKAGGTGLNIFQANHVIHYNLEWNPAVEDQASARAYRRGQTLPVTVHRLYYANTVEDIVNQRIEKKREMTEFAVIGHTGIDESIDDLVKALEISPLIGDGS